MAPPDGSLRVRGYFFALFAIISVLYLIVFFPGTRHTPRLGLDLEGGTQLVLRATTADGSAPSRDSLNEARNIINERVNGRGVAEAEVVTQGNDRIVVSIPGKGNADLDNIGTTARLNFRPLCQYPGYAAVLPTAPTTTPTATDSGTGATTSSTGTGTSTVAPQSNRVTEITDSPTTSPAPSPSPTATDYAPTDTGCTGPIAVVNQSTSTTPSGSATPSSTPAATSSTTAGATPSASPSATPSASPSASPSATDDAAQQAAISYYVSAGATQEQAVQLAALDCTKDTSRLDTPANANQPIVACSQDGRTKYILGRVLVPGTDIKSAAARAPDGQTNLQWTVVVELKGKGLDTWTKYTAAHNSSSASDTIAANYVAFTLDGRVISAPHTQGAINTPQTQVTGSFNQDTATDLANALKYGALPLTFTSDRVQNVSPTLGTTQLKAGLLAGGIGLILVVLYSLLYYRGLGLVTIASLLVSGALTYGSLVALGRGMGFTLTLAGVAGFIVAVGITADSFVVLFERIKDEVHEGRSFRVAVPRAWERARRTIVTADVVSLIAAVVLYWFTADAVRGFAFTLGLSTVLDLIVVFLFTHPLVALLSRSPAFGSAKFTGLAALRQPALAGVPSGAAPRPARAGKLAKPTKATKPEPRPSPSAAPPEATDAPSTAVAVDDVEPDDVADHEDVDATEVDKTDIDAIDAADVAAETDDIADTDDVAELGDVEQAGEVEQAGSGDATDAATDTATSTGTAAERAAARRARLREQRDQSGTEGTSS